MRRRHISEIKKQDRPYFDAGIFWDYENVALSKKNFKKFFEGLLNFLNDKQVYCEICSIKEIINSNILQIFENQNVKLNLTEGKGKNSSDLALKRAIQLFLNRYNTKKIVLITGDKHFKEIIKLIKSKNIKVMLIYKSDSVNKDLLKLANKRLSVEQICNDSSKWWLIDDYDLDMPSIDDSDIKIPPIDDKSGVYFCPMCNNLLKTYRKRKTTFLKCSICPYTYNYNKIID